MIYAYNKRIIPFIIILLHIFILSNASAQIYHAGDEITSYRLTNIVTLDGKWTNLDEWSDALEIVFSPRPYEHFSNTSGIAFCKVKHDGAYLYVLIDFISDTTPRSHRIESYHTDFAGVFLDPGGREDNSLSDAYGCFVSKHAGGVWHGKTKTKSVTSTHGAIFDWDNTQQTKGISKSSSDAKNDPYSKNEHMIYEFKIPLTRELTGRSEIGFFVVCDDTSTKSHMKWPAIVSPQYWATLYFSDKSFNERKEEVMPLIQDIETRIDSAKSSILNSSEAKSNLGDAIYRYDKAIEAFDAGNFESAEIWAKDAINGVDQALTTEALCANVTIALDEAIISIDNARSEGRTQGLQNATDLLEEAKLALLDDRHNESIRLAEEAKLLADIAKSRHALFSIGSYTTYIMIAGAISASIAIPFYARRRLGRYRKSRKEQYRIYLARLQELKRKNKISERAYKRLKRKYEKETT